VLERFINQEAIQDLHDPVYGQLFTNEDLKILDHSDFIPQDPNILTGQKSELHIYSFYGDYITGDHNAAHVLLDQYSNSFLLNVRETFKEAGITRGSYVIVSNLFQEVWGALETPVAIVREISADRTEIKFSIYDKKLLNEFEQVFKSKIQGLTDNNILNNLVVNFGFNRIQKIIKVKFDSKDPGIFYVKLYQPIYDEIAEKDVCWFGLEVVDPYIDTVLLTSPIHLGETRALKGPNFFLDTEQWNSNATEYKNWDQILDTNYNTRQRIIETSLSASGFSRLNIDYTSFENFIFYSSAEERLRNFHYKISKIQEYSSSISVLLSSTASQTVFVSASVDVNRNRINELTSNFDPWEQWLYYQPTASIFTHGLSGSLTPYPKRLIGGVWTPYSVSASISQTWYANTLVSASAFDVDNYNRLYWSIPEHIIMDPGSSNFVTFVDMVGQHFDMLYSYVKAIPQIHERDEHPERGPSKDLLWYIAKSFGWKLQNTRQLGDLWQYKLGYNQSGSYDFTGSLFSTSQEDQTFGIWRRIVNNLPYLFKTKGTERSVKALLSIYGIPSTILSIKEYGGPTIEADVPSWIEDRFQYEANFTGSNYIELNRRLIPIQSGSWSGSQRVPNTIEFNFRTNYTSSVSMSMWAIEQGSNRSQVLVNLMAVHKKYLDNGTSSFSGSDAYGKLKLIVNRWNPSSQQFAGGIVSTTSDYIPIFDNDSWTVKITTNYDFTQSSTATQIIAVTASRASDFSNGRIVQSGSLFATVVGSSNFTFAWGASTSSINTPHKILIGGTTGSMSGSAGITHGSSSRFIGQIFGYKEYFETISSSIYNQHVLNPAAYNGNESTSSYYTLFRYFPLGLDQQRWNHSTYTAVSSSHPNRRASFDTTASFVNWTGSQSSQYESSREIYYMYPPSLGGNTFKSQKIRLEDNRLLRDLSPEGRSERSRYDRSTNDSNRLAIVFAPSDHVNRDITNHMGSVVLDDWIGDPQYEFEDGYAELDRFGREYWQKYQQKNDINSFIRILSAYDYTFFEQIKQVVPGRADLIDGILIEDSILHRNKVRLSKRPTIEEPYWEQSIPGNSPTASGDLLNYETSASFNVICEISYNYMTGSIDDVLMLSSSMLSHFSAADQRTGLCGSSSAWPNPYSGSQSVTQSYYDRMRPDCCYSKVIYHYSASGNFANKYQKQWYTAVSMSYKMHYSRSLDCWYYQINECSMQNNSRYRGSKLEGPDFNINSPDTIDGGPVITIRESNPNQLFVFDNPQKGNLKVE
jgi:hypothetical protein